MGLFSLSLFSLALLPTILGSVPTSEFFPYGTQNGDLKVPIADDNFVNVPLSTPFHFFGRTYPDVYVNNNGGLSFGQGVSSYTPNCGPLTTPMIVPYWADVDTNRGGSVFYRETTDPTLLAQAKSEVQAAFPGTRNFQPVSAFITTWSDVAFFGEAVGDCTLSNIKNTYQSIIVTDGSASFAIFNYADINWTTGRASGGDCSGFGGTPAKAGFDFGDGVNFVSIPGSCSADVQQITSTSNVNRDGKWIFRVDQQHIESADEVEENLPNSEAPVFISSEQPQIWSTTEEPHYASDQPIYYTSQQPDPIFYTSQQPDPIFYTSQQPDPIYQSTIEPAEPVCDPSSCVHSGHCFSYTFCDHLTRTWAPHDNCSAGLFWNPKSGYRQPSGSNASGIEGEDCTGSCDIWENLDEATKNKYRQDRSCFPACYFQPMGECSANYIFHPQDTDARDVQVVSCPHDNRPEGMGISLVWVQEKETCDFCYNARRRDGSQCCTKYDSVQEAATASPETEFRGTTPMTEEVASSPNYELGSSPRYEMGSSPSYESGSGSSPSYNWGTTPNYDMGTGWTDNPWYWGTSPHWQQGSGATDNYWNYGTSPNYWESGTGNPWYWGTSPSWQSGSGATDNYWNYGTTRNWQSGSGATDNYWNYGTTPNWQSGSGATDNYWNYGTTPNWGRYNTDNYYYGGQSTQSPYYGYTNQYPNPFYGSSPSPGGVAPSSGSQNPFVTAWPAPAPARAPSSGFTTYDLYRPLPLATTRAPSVGAWYNNPIQPTRYPMTAMYGRKK